MELIKDLWRGDVPLVKTYWLFGVVVGILLNFSFTYIEYRPAVFASFLGMVFVLGLVAFAFIYSAFICVAIWRSADKYPGARRNVILAKIAVVLGVMAIIQALLEVFGPTPPA